MKHIMAQKKSSFLTSTSDNKIQMGIASVPPEFIANLNLDVPTPLWLQILDVFVLLLIFSDFIFKIHMYRRNRLIFTLFLVICSGALLIIQFVNTMSIGFRAFDPIQSSRILLFGFATTGHIYIIIMFKRCLAFPHLLPNWFYEKKRVAVGIIGLIAFGVHAILLWPMYLYIFNPYVELQNPWINHYHFVSWGIWGFLLCFADLCLCFLSVRRVIQIKRGVNFELENGSLTAEQRTWYVITLSLLSTCLGSDVLYLFLIISHISNFQHLDAIQINMLADLIFAHIIIVFAALIALGKVARARSGENLEIQAREWRMSPIHRPDTDKEARLIASLSKSSMVEVTAQRSHPSITPTS
jgi:hypothetical protein